MQKILVVDDNKGVLDVIVGILTKAHYEVIWTDRGKEAIELVKNDQPDLIILDIMLPDMDGSEVASVICDDPATAKIPIIFLTGILSKEEEAATAVSSNHYVMAKPVKAKELLGMVAKVLPA